MRGKVNRWGVAVAAGSGVLGAAAYGIANRLAPGLSASNAWFGYLLLLPVLGFLCGAPAHFFAGDRPLREAAGAGFGAGTLLASGAAALLAATGKSAGSLAVMAALAGLAFGIGFAFGPAAAALARMALGREAPGSDEDTSR